MSENLNHIDNIVKEHLESSSAGTSNLKWNQIDKKVSKMNFLKFGLSHFNVFYSVAIVVIVVGTGSFFGINLNNNNKTADTQENVVVTEDLMPDDTKSINKTTAPNGVKTVSNKNTTISTKVKMNSLPSKKAIVKSKNSTSKKGTTTYRTRIQKEKKTGTKDSGQYTIVRERKSLNKNTVRRDTVIIKKK